MRVPVVWFTSDLFLCHVLIQGRSLLGFYNITLKGREGRVSAKTRDNVLKLRSFFELLKLKNFWRKGKAISDFIRLHFLI